MCRINVHKLNPIYYISLQGRLWHLQSPYDSHISVTICRFHLRYPSHHQWRWVLYQTTWQRQTCQTPASCWHLLEPSASSRQVLRFRCHFTWPPWTERPGSSGTRRRRRAESLRRPYVMRRGRHMQKQGRGSRDASPKGLLIWKSKWTRCSQLQLCCLIVAMVPFHGSEGTLVRHDYHIYM